MAPAAELLGRTTSATAALGSDIGSGMAEKVRMLEEEVAALQEKARAEAAEAASKARILEGKVAAQEVVHAAQLKAAAAEAAAKAEVERVEAELNAQKAAAQIAAAEEKAQEGKLSDLWAHFDTDKNDKLDKQELEQVLACMGKQVDDAGLDALMTEIDTDNDGQVSQEEMLEWWKRQDAEHHRAAAAAVRAQTEAATLELEKKLAALQAAHEKLLEADAKEEELQAEVTVETDALLASSLSRVESTGETKLVAQLKQQVKDLEKRLAEAETQGQDGVVGADTGVPEANPKKAKKVPARKAPDPEVDLERVGGPELQSNSQEMVKFQEADGARKKVRWGSLWTDVDYPVVQFGQSPKGSCQWWIWKKGKKGDFVAEEQAQLETIFAKSAKPKLTPEGGPKPEGGPRSFVPKKEKISCLDPKRVKAIGAHWLLANPAQPQAQVACAWQVSRWRLTN